MNVSRLCSASRSHEKRHNMIVKVKLDMNEPEIETVSDIWMAANWYEREAGELFGIKFLNHPDPRHLLLDDDWEYGYPLEERMDRPGFHSDAGEIDGSNLRHKRSPRRRIYRQYGAAAPVDTRRASSHASRWTANLSRAMTPHVGYLHRSIEKIAENRTYNQFMPYTDRIDYCASMPCNQAWAVAVEKLARSRFPSAPNISASSWSS